MSDGGAVALFFGLGFLVSISVVGPITQSMVDDSWRKQIVARGYAAYTVDAHGRANWNWIEPQKVEASK